MSTLLAIQDFVTSPPAALFLENAQVKFSTRFDLNFLVTHDKKRKVYFLIKFRNYWNGIASEAKTKAQKQTMIK